MSRYPVVTGLLIGSALSGKDVIDCRDAGTDPALFQQTLGITWDYLELCLSYGLGFEQIKGVALDAPQGEVNRHLRSYPISGSDGWGEDVVCGPGPGYSGIMPMIGDSGIAKNLAENPVDGAANGLFPRLLVGARKLFGRVQGKRGGLASGQQGAEPRAFAPQPGKLEQDRVGGEFERSDTRSLCRVGHDRLSFTLRQVTLP